MIKRDNNSTNGQASWLFVIKSNNLCIYGRALDNLNFKLSKIFMRRIHDTGDSYYHRTKYGWG
jgi:hypothetical protein